MNPGRYFMPNMAMNPMMLRNGYGMYRSTGLIERMIQGIRSLNWSKFLNGANKTLNVMNQTIPLIRQTKPMVGNVKSMVKLARAFGNATNNVKTTSTTNHNNNLIKSNITYNKKSNIDDDYPTFFV